MNYQFSINDLADCGATPDLYASLLLVCEKYKKQRDDSFFSELSKLIHEYTSVSRSQEFNDNAMLKIKDCLAIAIQFFKEANNENNIAKLLVALHILDFFEQDYRLLDVKSIREDFRNKIVSVTEEIELKINIPDDASYSERKMMEVFNEAKAKNDYREVIGIMDTLVYHSFVFTSLEHTCGVLIRFSFFLDKKSVLNILDKHEASYEKIEAFLYALRNNVSSDIDFAVHNNYLALRLFKYWLAFLEESYAKTNRLQEMPDYAEQMICVLSNSDLHIEKYIDVLRISYLKSYNYLMGRMVKTNASFLPLYINHISTGAEESEVFSKGFLERITEDTDEVAVCNVIESVKSAFFLKNVHSYTGINLHTGYLNLFACYFCIKYKDRISWLSALADYDCKIKNAQNSWNHESIAALWIDLYYFCLSNATRKFYFSETELKSAIPVLFDKRNELIYDAESFRTMTALLMSPDIHIKITMKSPTNSDVIIEINC